MAIVTDGTRMGKIQRPAQKTCRDCGHTITDRTCRTHQTAFEKGHDENCRQRSVHDSCDYSVISIGEINHGLRNLTIDTRDDCGDINIGGFDLFWSSTVEEEPGGLELVTLDIYVYNTSDVDVSGQVLCLHGENTCLNLTISGNRGEALSTTLSFHNTFHVKISDTLSCLAEIKAP